MIIKSVYHRLTRLSAIFCASAIFLGTSAFLSAAEPASSINTVRQSSEVGQTSNATATGADQGQSEARSEKTTDIDVEVLSRGTSSAIIRNEAIKRLPLNQLNAQQRKTADEVLRSQSLFRRLPTVSFESHSDVYRYFLAHPDVAVSIWRVMKISKVEMWQTGKHEFESDAGDGSLCYLEVLSQTPAQTLLYCEGKFKTPLLRKPIHGRALLHLQTIYSRDGDKRTYVTHHVDMFVAFPSNAVEAAAKLISPVCNMLADRNFREISMFLRMMSLAMENRPGWVEHVAERMDGVLPIREAQVLKLTAHVYIEARERALAAAGMKAEEVTIDHILSPLKILKPGEKYDLEEDPAQQIFLDKNSRETAKSKTPDSGKPTRIATENKSASTANALKR